MYLSCLTVECKVLQSGKLAKPRQVGNLEKEKKVENVLIVYYLPFYILGRAFI